MSPEKTSAAAATAAFSLASVAGCLHRSGPKNDQAAFLWAVLRYLNEAPESAANCPAFAEAHGISARSARRSMAALEEDGYLRRKPHPDDARGYILKISAKGRRALAKDPLRPLAARLAQTLSETELDVIARILLHLSLTASQWSVDASAERFGALVEPGEFESLSELGDDGCDDDGEAAEPNGQAFAIMRALSMAARFVQKAGSNETMTRPEWNALRYFAIAPAKSATQSDFGRCFLLSAGAASGAIRQAKDRGYLAYIEYEPGRRVKGVRLTKAGVAILPDDPNLKIARALQPAFTDEELQLFTKAMAAIFLEYSFEGAGEDPLPGGGPIPVLNLLTPASDQHR